MYLRKTNYKILDITELTYDMVQWCDCVNKVMNFYDL